VVSVAGFVVSTFVELSAVVFIEDDESTFAESAELPDLLPLQAATDMETAIAKREILSTFFIVFLIKVLRINIFYEGMFGDRESESPKSRKSPKEKDEAVALVNVSFRPSKVFRLSQTPLLPGFRTFPTFRTFGLFQKKRIFRALQIFRLSRISTSSGLWDFSDFRTKKNLSIMGYNFK